MGIDTFESDLLNDVKFNDDGSLKLSGKQNVKFYNKKRMSYKAKPLLKDGVQVFDKMGKPVFDIDPKTGIPFKIAFEEMVEMVRVETRGDTNIIDDIADDLRKAQFYPQYKYFREGKNPEGTSIDTAEWLYPQTVMELRLMGLHVIEQLALMTEVECERLRDQSGFEIRDLAAQWVRINSTSGQAGRADRLALEVERLKRELADSQAQGAGRARLQMIQEEALKNIEPEVQERTIEMPLDELKKGRGRPKRLVE